MSLNYMKLEKEYNLTQEDNIRLEQHLNKINQLLNVNDQKEGMKKVAEIRDDNYKLKESIVLLNRKVDSSQIKCEDLEDRLNEALREGT